MKPSAPAHFSPRRQLGAASVAIAMLIMFILAAAVLAVMNMSGSSVIDAAKNEEQVAALFLAESGLERGQGQIQSANNPTLPNICTGINISGVTLGRGAFTLIGTPSPTGCDGTTTKCVKCTITSTGAIPATGTVSSSRTVVRVMSLSAPSGGANGCGGGGVTPVICPTAAPASDKYPDIVQQIKVTTPPAILLSNMAYSRHPQGGANNINATGCVALSGTTSINCITQWNDESNHSSGSNVVGSRGASAYIDTAGTYKMKQNLTADSLFAAVGVKVEGASPSIVGSYWDDNSGNGAATAAGNATASGQTNNGAACNPGPFPPQGPTPPGLCSAIVPPSSIPNPPSSGSMQTGNGWCYDADTLVFGLSGTSSNGNNGALTSFQFGAATGQAVNNGFAIYPATHGNDTQIYSSMWYVHNSAYMSAPDAVSGAAFNGFVGKAFTGYISKNSTTLTVISVDTGVVLAVGDTVPNTNPIVPGLDLGTTISGLETGTGGAGTYTVTKQSKNHYGATSTTPINMAFASKILTVTTPPTPTGSTIAVGDNIFLGTTSLADPIVSLVPGTTGGMGQYNLAAANPAMAVPLNALQTDGATVMATSTTAPTPTAMSIAIAWTGSGTGTLATGTTVAAIPVPTTTKFTLSARPITPLSGVKICGGICAFFNHSSATAKTNFTIGITNTNQWAAGMTCLKVGDTFTITGLTGISGTVQPTNWYEPVK